MKKIITITLLFAVNYAFGQNYISLQPAILSANPTGLDNNSTNTTNSPVPLANGAGTRLMWIPSRSAFRVGSVFNNNGGPQANYWNASFIGLFSFASGANTKASGKYSTSMGFDSYASGYASTSIGDSTNASGEASTSMGSGTRASGRYSTSMGYQTKASGQYSTSMGALTTASGSYSTSIGFNTTASGVFSTSIGYGTTAYGTHSFSTGFETTAGGDYATSMGQLTNAGGIASTSMGAHTVAQAFNSVVMGRYNITSGDAENWVGTDQLFVVGNGLSISNPSNALTVLKNGNVGIGDATPTEARLVVNNSSTGAGTVAIFGGNTSGIVLENNHPGFGFNGYYTGGRKPLVNGFVGGMVMNPTTGQISIYNSSASGTAGVNLSTTSRITIDNQGYVGIGDETPAAKLDVNGAVRCVSLTQTSDARFKKNIKPLENALSNILKIDGLRYDWRREEFPEKNFSDKNQIGFIAQELEKIYPEMVETDNKGYKSVDYTRLTPVLVEAMKEQQKLIEELKNKNQKLESRLDKIEALLSK